MGEHQRSVLQEQLAYSKAFLQTAATDELAAWRSASMIESLASTDSGALAGSVRFEQLWRSETCGADGRGRGCAQG